MKIKKKLIKSLDLQMVILFDKSYFFLFEADFFLKEFFHAEHILLRKFLYHRHYMFSAKKNLENVYYNSSERIWLLNNT